MSKRSIKEVYDLIKEKKDNTERDIEIAILVGDRLDMDNLVGEVDAYNDILNLIESSHLLEEDKSKKALEIIKNKEVNVFDVLATNCADYYNMCVNIRISSKYCNSYFLTQEEYELLKKVLS